MKTFRSEYGVFKVFNADILTIEALSSGKLPNQERIEEKLYQYITGATTIITVGSCIGSAEIMFTKINPSINIYCFEPREKCFCLLSKNLALNNIENVIIMNNALGHMQGSMQVPYKDDICCDHEEIIELCNGSFVASTDLFCFVSIDSLKLIRCDMVYIDLKGFEYLALIGGINTIRKFKPTICFSYEEQISNNMLTFLAIQQDIFDLLDKLDYQVQQYHGYVIAVPKPLE